jgi:hypothetical protein
MVHSLEEKLLELDSIVVESIFPVRANTKNGYIFTYYPLGNNTKCNRNAVMIPITDFDTMPSWDIYNKYLKGIFHTPILQKDEFEP